MSEKNMNKAEFVSFIASRGRSSKAEAERMLNTVTDGMISAFGAGNSISIVGFGSFKIKQRAARDGRNPKTGAQMRIAAYKQVVFTPGKSIKDSVK